MKQNDGQIYIKHDCYPTNKTIKELLEEWKQIYLVPLMPVMSIKKTRKKMHAK